jgi:hypothetical protein
VAVKFATAQLGKPYRWGADGPRSFDCSGLVQTAYRAAGVALPRVSRQQYGAGTHVSLRSLRAGDLLFYAKDTSDPRTIYHVGMYLGAGRMVEAPNRRAPVRIAAARRPGLVAKATRPAPGGRVVLPVQLGERGKAVATVQQRLVANQVCVAVDGDFGPRTWGALVTFGRQRSPPAAEALLSSAACESAAAGRWSSTTCGPTGSTRPSASPGRASWPSWTPCTTARPG